MMMCKSCGRQTLHQRDELVNAFGFNHFYWWFMADYLDYYFIVAYDRKTCICCCKSMDLFTVW